MTSPSKPLNIASPRAGPSDVVSGSFTTPLGTPDLRALRSHYAAGTSPPPNIPPRLASAIPTRCASPLPATSSADASPRPPLIVRPGSPSSDVHIPDLDDLPHEEKAKVLRRHLVSKEERMPPPEARSSAASDAEISDQRTSPTSSIRRQLPQREETEPFPIPYHAPGADIT